MRVESNYQPPFTASSIPKSQENNTLDSLSAIQSSTNPLSDVWGKLREKYNVRNATFEELSQVSSQLYEAGAITLLNHATMTFNPSVSPQAVKPNIFLTNTDITGRRNWITEFQARVDRSLQLNDLQGARINKEVVGILNRIA